jgi:hypothetical protein
VSDTEWSTPDYWFPERRYSRPPTGIVFMSRVKKTPADPTRGQGEWLINGVPSGGFNVHPIRDLIESKRKDGAT